MAEGNTRLSDELANKGEDPQSLVLPFPVHEYCPISVEIVKFTPEDFFEAGFKGDGESLVVMHNFPLLTVSPLRSSRCCHVGHRRDRGKPRVLRLCVSQSLFRIDPL